jgi:hypothetical protein
LNVAQFLLSLSRRPLALALIAILAILAGVAGWMSTSHIYNSTAAAVVVPPGSGSPDAGLNPLINLNSNMSQLAAVVATMLQTNAGRQAAKDAGGTGNFTVSTLAGDQVTGSELTAQLVIVAEGTDPESARRAAVALVESAGDCLNKVQLDSGVPVVNNAQLTSSVEPQAGAKVPTNPIRGAAAYALGTVLAGVVLLLIFDALLQWIRSRERHRRPDRMPPAANDARAVAQGDARVAAEADWRAAIAARSLDESVPGRNRTPQT